MHEYGTTKEQLAEIAVATRKWAMLNPKAMMRDPITIEDVLASRPIAYPFNLLDCCLVTDAGGAVVLTSLERARDCRQTPVAVLGVGEGHDHSLISQMPSLTAFAARGSGERRSEEHTSELQSRQYLVCRLLLEKKKKTLSNRIAISISI